MSLPASVPPPPCHQMLPAGWVAEVVTYLEMRKLPPPRADTAAGLVLVRMPADIAAYRRLFRLVGEPWLWASQLRRSDADLAAVLSSEAVETYTLRAGSDDIGLLQLDFRTDGACELAFFGVVPEAIGVGAGRFLMNRAIERAWSRMPRISRFWVHTCTNDHPDALGFYMRSGFAPYARGIECYPDPRLEGLLPKEAAPQIPII
ncbi:MAG: GNAT family N-acetyltransferase [Hyphomicrobiaceae bacterium]